MRRAIPLTLALLLLVTGSAAGIDPPAPAGDDPVIGLSFRGMHSAYPLKAFSPCRVLNDVVGRQEVVVYHDPARGISTAWFRTVFGEPIEFSGQVAGTIADDLTTITRWDMTTGEAVGGNLAGQRLIPVPILTTSWSGWLAKHPDTKFYSQERP